MFRLYLIIMKGECGVGSAAAEQWRSTDGPDDLYGHPDTPHGRVRLVHHTELDVQRRTLLTQK